MKKFTEYQKQEILELLHIRQETIEDDIESATKFEATDGALDELKRKIESGDMNFSELEIQWIIEECEMRIDVCHANESSEGIKVYGLANSMQNAISKIVK